MCIYNNVPQLEMDCIHHSSEHWAFASWKQRWLPTFEGGLSWTCRSLRKWQGRSTGGQLSNHHRRVASRKIWSVEKLETLSAGTKPRISHHRSPMVFLEGTREGQRQSDQHWNCFKGNIEETQESRGGAHMDLPERIYTILNWTELNSTESKHTRGSKERYLIKTRQNKMQIVGKFWLQHSNVRTDKQILNASSHPVLDWTEVRKQKQNLILPRSYDHALDPESGSVDEVGSRHQVLFLWLSQSLSASVVQIGQCWKKKKPHSRVKKFWAVEASSPVEDIVLQLMSLPVARIDPRDLKQGPFCGERITYICSFTSVFPSVRCCVEGKICRKIALCFVWSWLNSVHVNLLCVLICFLER